MRHPSDPAGAPADPPPLPAPPAARPRALLTEADWQRLHDVVRLSTRERQIVALLLEDEKESAIGRRLGISPHTVHTYVERLYRKLGVASRVQLIVVLLASLLRAPTAPAPRPARAVSPPRSAAALPRATAPSPGREPLAGGTVPRRGDPARPT